MHEHAAMAWLAGILEGEGCFLRRRSSNVGKNKERYVMPVIALKMTDEDVVRRVAVMFNGAAVTRFDPVERRKAGRLYTGTLPSYTTRITCEPAVVLMRALRPMMGARRGAKIDELVAEWDARTYTKGDPSVWRACRLAVAVAKFERMLKTASAEQAAPGVPGDTCAVTNAGLVNLKLRRTFVAWTKREAARRGESVYEVVEQLASPTGDRPWRAMAFSEAEQREVDRKLNLIALANAAASVTPEEARARGQKAGTARQAEARRKGLTAKRDPKTGHFLPGSDVPIDENRPQAKTAAERQAAYRARMREEVMATRERLEKKPA